MKYHVNKYTDSLKLKGGRNSFGNPWIGENSRKFYDIVFKIIFCENVGEFLKIYNVSRASFP